MKVSIRKRVSMERLMRPWSTFKSALEYLHLTEFLLHLGQSDALALLILAFTRPAGWVGVAILAALWSVWLTVQPDKEVPQMVHNEKEQAAELPAAKLDPAEITLPTPNIPQNLVDLAKQGICVKITIELKPAAR